MLRSGCVPGHHLDMGRRLAAAGIVADQDVARPDVRRVGHPLEQVGAGRPLLGALIVQGAVGHLDRGGLDAGLGERIADELIALVPVLEPVEPGHPRRLVARQLRVRAGRGLVGRVVGAFGGDPRRRRVHDVAAQIAARRLERVEGLQRGAGSLEAGGALVAVEAVDDLEQLVELAATRDETVAVEVGRADVVQPEARALEVLLDVGAGQVDAALKRVLEAAACD